MNFIDSFDITVRTLDDIFPWWKNRWDNIFYDIKSFAQCLRSKFAIIRHKIHAQACLCLKGRRSCDSHMIVMCYTPSFVATLSLG